jgi:hypothetical protein
MPKLTQASGRAFDAGLAAFAAASAGFVVFAMPQTLFSGLVQASRLPAVLAAAQPPLGETARLGAVGAAFLLTFAAIWALMAALGRVPERGETVAEPEAQAPRLRRADAHPDAPPRPPLLARDLGEPLELEDVAEDPREAQSFAEAEHRALPGFLVPQEPEPVAEAEPQPEPEPEPETQTEDLPIAELAARLPDAEESVEESDQPLSQLVNRIEFGLSRKRQALPAADLPTPEEPPIEQERVGHRLRSAINDLEKIASSGT